MKNIVKLIVSILICEGAGIVGSIFTVPAIKTWYASLNKPFFSPPNWIFAPVWIVLFLLMGISLYLVWASPRLKKDAVLIFILQLILNVLWSIIFFGLKSPGLALFEILMLWFAILYTIVNFYRISKSASFLLLPYILWVTFAAILNFAVWRLN